MGKDDIKEVKIEVKCRKDDKKKMWRGGNIEIRKGKREKDKEEIRLRNVIKRIGGN